MSSSNLQHFQSPSSPQQNPPSPALEQLHVLVINVRVSMLDSRSQLLKPLLHSPGNPDGHLVGKHKEHGKHDEG
ncbi:hypothetical protein HG530_000763 [Fusarium avenaceum]|nr:hypothetical protein HG530_000763 [Fusarium avenaceum]